MKYLRNKNTGKQIAYDAKLLELGYYEVIDDQAEAVKTEAQPPAMGIPTLVADDAIKAAAAKLLKRKTKAPQPGIQDDVPVTEEISIQLVRGE